MRDFIIPLLSEHDIDCRVQSVASRNETVKAILLLYKDARVDMRLLDQVFGPGGWQRTHEVINGNLFCNIDLWDEDKHCWIRKQDVGVESNTEKEKGQASDSFKRAGFNVGIGRELYTAPFISVELKAGEWRAEQFKDKTVYKCLTSFKVAHIAYNEKREICELIIVDRTGAERFSMGSKGSRKKAAPKAPDQKEENKAESCPVCGGAISEAEIGYSTKKYGKAMCRTCQKSA